MSFEQIILHYGYLAVGAGALLEGETAMLLAGFAVQQGYISLPLTLLIAYMGTFIADQGWFYLGRWKGIKVIENRPQWKSRAERVHNFLAKYQNAVILLFRFVYGFRAVTPVLLGAVRISPVRYTLLNAVGCIVWATIFVMLGHVLGSAVHAFITHAYRIEITISVAVALLLMLVLLFGRVRKKPAQ